MEFNIDLSQFMRLESLFSSGMSKFQMEHFVINDHITPYRRLKQAIVEARARLEAATMIGFDIEELDIKQEAAKDRKDKAMIGTERALATIEINRYSFEKDRKKKTLDQLHSEIKFFTDAIDDIVKNNFDSYDDAFNKLNDVKYIDKCETEFWTEKLSRSVFSDLINYNTISKGVFESILCLPEEQMETIISNGVKKHIEHTKESSSLIDKSLALLDK